MRVLIGGAGIAGLTLACCLERRGLQPLVIEHAPALRDDGYMIDFFGSGYDAAERLELLSDLAAIHYPIDKLAFIDNRGHQRFEISYALLRLRLFNERHFNFLRGELERVLYERFHGRAAIRFGTTVSSIIQEEQSVAVTLSDGTEQSVDLLVGADGVHSHVRRLTFGSESQFIRRLGYEMAAYILDGPVPTVGRDKFLTVTFPGRQLNLYPIRGDRMATFFIHRQVDSTETGTRRQSDCARLREIYGDVKWVVPDLLARCDSASSVLRDAVIQIRVPRWSKGGLCS